MSAERRSGKARIEHVRRLAKEHGVELLGWNDKPGKEFVTLMGAMRGTIFAIEAPLATSREMPWC
jgi:hypothetical protein